MSIAELPLQGDTAKRGRISEWKRFGDASRHFECRVLLCPEDGGFSIHALDLPGVVSQGDTVKEAIANIVDAYQESIASYRDSSDAIPWGAVIVDDAPRGSKELRIVVNA
jgi:predicted RNase H-like HicB family nuclease